MKTCNNCKTDKPLDAYHLRAKSPDGRQANCKDCNRAQRSEYYRSAKGRENNVANGVRQRAKNRVQLIEYLKTHPCITCGEADIVVLEFDHRDPSTKERNVSAMIKGSSWENILKEIEKCDVLCANCHRRRTALQFGWAKLL